MCFLLNSLRPGVYSSYSISNQNYSLNKIVVIASCNSSIPFQNYSISSFQQALEIFGKDSNSNNIIKLIQPLFQNYPSNIFAIPLISGKSYSDAFDIISGLNQSYIILSDIHLESDIKKLKLFLDLSEEKNNEKIAVLSIPPTYNPLEFATYINHKRISISYPPIYHSDEDSFDISHSLLASIFSSSSSYYNFSNYSINHPYIIKLYIESSKQEDLMNHGISLFEKNYSNISLIRAFSSNAFNPDGDTISFFRNIHSIISIDKIIPHIRENLKKNIHKFFSNSSSIDNIKSLVICDLDLFKSNNLISDYKDPSVSFDKSDPSICFVSISFALSFSINKIFINANISI